MQQRLLLLLVVVPASAFVATHHGTTPLKKVRRKAWGDDVAWSDVEVVANDELGEGLRGIKLCVSEAAVKAYTTPGQFVQLKLGDDGKPGFFAIASAPSNASDFEFLIKETENNGWLTGAKSGASLSMSDPAGKGYDMTPWQGELGEIDPKFDGFGCTNYLFLAQGTGIAPIRATIESGVATGLSKPATLFYGVRDSKHCAYADKYDAWLADYNVKAIEIHSQPEPGWTGVTGYVQNVVLAAKPALKPRNSGAIICGNKDFFTANKQLLTDLGVFEDRILTNF